MPVKVFVDTNIWLYALIQSEGEQGDERHQRACDFLCQLHRPVINSQIIRETCANLIKKVKMPKDTVQRLLQGWYRDSGDMQHGQQVEGQLTIVNPLKT